MCTNALQHLVVVRKCSKALVLSLGFSVFLILLARPPPFYMRMHSGVLLLSVVRVPYVHLFSTSMFKTHWLLAHLTNDKTYSVCTTDCTNSSKEVLLNRQMLGHFYSAENALADYISTTCAFHWEEEMWLFNELLLPWLSCYQKGLPTMSNQ